jgi:hypothetical protein
VPESAVTQFCDGVVRLLLHSSRFNTQNLPKRPDRLRNSASLLFTGYGVLPRGKSAVTCSWQFTTIYCWGWEWTELYLYSPYMPSWLNRDFTIPYYIELKLTWTVHTTYLMHKQDSNHPKAGQKSETPRVRMCELQLMDHNSLQYNVRPSVCYYRTASFWLKSAEARYRKSRPMTGCWNGYCLNGVRETIKNTSVYITDTTVDTWSRYVPEIATSVTIQ